MSLKQRLLKNSTIKETDVLCDSKVFNTKDMITTSVPAINIALSSKVDGGLTPGLLMLAGPSKHFKSGFALLMAKSYLDKYPDSIMLFYDSEFGTPQSYFDAFGIDTNRVVHTPVTNIEQLKHDISKQLDEITTGDKVIIIIDSIGNLASKKEVEDAMDGKSVADMTRAKQLKSTFRIITPHLTLKDIPLIAINHTYKTMELYSKDIVGGGCVAPDTEVLMSDGNYKIICDILPGEHVQTLLGEKEVEYTWDYTTLIEGEPECYEVTFDDGFTVVCSYKHRFLNDKNEWIEARDIKEGMMFIS